MRELSFDRFVVTSDEGDWSWTGHNHFYSISVARAALAKGHRPVILAPVRATPGFDDGVEIIPYVQPQQQLVGGRQVIRQLALKWIPMSWSRNAARLGRSVLSKALALRHQWSGPAVDQVAHEAPAGSFGLQIAEAIRTGVLRESDLVFVHTVLTQSLESVLLALLSLKGKPLPNFQLTLRTDPHEVATRYGRRMDLASILNGFWQHEWLRERVRFLTDTAELKREYDELSPFIFCEIPIPVAIRRSPRRDSSGQAGKKITITYVGAIRRERGFQLLPKLAEHLALRKADRAIHLVVQAGGLDKVDDPQVQMVLSTLERYTGTVEIVRGSLSPDRYSELLQAADLILLPYDASRYVARSSGVLAEALSIGCPTVVPDGTWMSRVAGDSCTRIRSPGDADALCAAVDEALGSLDAIRTAALELSKAWSTSATPERLFSSVVSAENCAHTTDNKSSAHASMNPGHR